VSGRRRGIILVPGLLIFAIIVAISIGFLYIFSFVPVVKDVVAIKSQLQVILVNIDRGSALASLFESTSGGTSFMEIVGNSAAEGFPEGPDAAVLDTIERLGGGLSVMAGGRTVREYGTLTSSRVKADIALPGGMKGEVTGS
jgi:hypothetical protein